MSVRAAPCRHHPLVRELKLLVGMSRRFEGHADSEHAPHEPHQDPRRSRCQENGNRGHHPPRRRVFVAPGATKTARAIRTRHGRIVDCVLGVLAPAAHFRPLLIPTPVHTPDHFNNRGEHGCDQDANGDNKRRSRWRPWAELLKRSFDIDLRCPHCNASMKLKSFLTSPKNPLRLLTRLGETTEVQAKAPARGPPYFASKVLRQRFAEQQSQLDMLD